MRILVFVVAIVLGVGSVSEASPWDFSQWAVDGGEKAAAGDGALRVAYGSSGHGAVVVRPPGPIALPGGTARVRWWYARLAGDFDLVLLLRDGGGRERAVPTFTSRPVFPTVRRSRMREYSMWDQAESLNVATADAVEARVEPEFRESVRKLEWKEPLSVVGIRIEPAKTPRDNEAHGDAANIRAGKGELVLAEPGWGTKDGFDAALNWHLIEQFRWGWDSMPCLFPDELSMAKGDVRFEVSVRRGYQGPVVWRTGRALALDRADPMGLWGQRIELPVLPPGRYFIHAKAWRGAGVFEREKVMQLFVAGRRKGEGAGVAGGVSGWETGRKDHVFPREARAARLTLRLVPEDLGRVPRGATCEIAVRDWRGALVHEASVPPAADVVVECAGLSPGTDYRAVAELRRGKVVFDRFALHFGVASPPTTQAAPPKDIPTRDELLSSGKPLPIAEHWGTLMGEDDREPVTEDRLREFDRWLEEAASFGFRVISFMMAWGEVEPLPGVFRWDEIERRLQLAEGKGMKVLLTPTDWGNRCEYPAWKDFDLMMNQFGYIDQIDKERELKVAAHDPVRREEFAHWYRSVAARFVADPAVIGYRSKRIIFNERNKPEYSRGDYSLPAREALAAWQKREGRAASPMAPLYTIMGHAPVRSGPDLSPGWRDFLDFRTATYLDETRQLLAGIRAADPVRQIHVYRSPVVNALEPAIPLLRDGGSFHDEGGPFYFQRAIESLCIQAGVPYTGEGHQFTPPSVCLADSAFFYPSLFDRGWCYLYRWNIHRADDPRFKALPEVLGFIRDSMPALGEWVAAEGFEPETLVFGSRADRLIRDGRQGFYAYIAGLDVFTALFSFHGVRAHFADEYAAWVDVAKFPLVLVCGEVMTRAAIERIVAHVKAGGKVVLVGDAGKYCVEERGARNALAGALANLPNVRRIAPPSHEPPPPGGTSYADAAFDGAELDAILEWAGVKRRVSASGAGFECAIKRGSGNTRYVAVFRRWPGSYDNVWYDEDVRAKWGAEGTEITVEGLADGAWRVEKFHRSRKDMGRVEAKGGTLRFAVEPALAGEMQLFRLTALGEGRE